MSRKEELERLHRQSLASNGYGNPARALRDGVPPPRRCRCRWVWIVILLAAAGIGGWFAYTAALERQGRTTPPVLSPGDATDSDGKLAKEGATKVTPEPSSAVSASTIPMSAVLAALGAEEAAAAAAGASVSSTISSM